MATLNLIPAADKCIRGFVCRHCNLALGAVKDSIVTLENLIQFLKNSEGGQ